jgi:hypothetical protein
MRRRNFLWHPRQVHNGTDNDLRKNRLQCTELTPVMWEKRGKLSSRPPLAPTLPLLHFGALPCRWRSLLHFGS